MGGIPIREATMATEDIPTWEAAILNARYLAEFGSWRFSPNDARGLLGHLKNEEREQLGIKASSEGEWYQKLADRLNYPVVRAAMSILASDAITSGPAAKPYTQKTFGDALQDLGFPPGDRTVKSWVIPLLHHAG